MQSRSHLGPPVQRKGEGGLSSYLRGCSSSVAAAPRLTTPLAISPLPAPAAPRNTARSGDTSLPRAEKLQHSQSNERTGSNPVDTMLITPHNPIDLNSRIWQPNWARPEPKVKPSSRGNQKYRHRDIHTKAPGHGGPRSSIVIMPEKEEVNGQQDDGEGAHELDGTRRCSSWLCMCVASSNSQS